MRLYSGTTASLIEDTTKNRIATKLTDAFFHEFRFQPGPSEVNSWRNSLRAVSQVFQEGSLMNNGVILEFELPLTSRRLDCLVTGRNDSTRDNAVIVELKQWDKCEDGGGRNELATWVGSSIRDVLHPSAQVGQYKTYLEDAHTAFDQDSGIQLNACSYLHNYPYEPSDVLFADRFKSLLESFPLFTGDDVDKLIGFLRLRVATGDEGEIVKTIEQSQYKASRKLLEHVTAVVKGNSQYVLLDEQLVVYDRVLQAATDGVNGKKINNTLQIKRTANVLWNAGDQVFDFKICPSPQALETAIREKTEQGLSARMTAGFCWKWSDPRPDGSLVEDVVIGDYARPWNAKSTAGHLAPGIPPESLWAYQIGGLNQVGCIYTAQGFEFDYVGVIVGTDLVFGPGTAEWKGEPSASADPVVRRSRADFLRNVKNTYRVLLSRGMKGCYVCFLDKATETFLRSRMEVL